MIIGKEIAGVEVVDGVVDGDYLMVVEMEEDCSMNVHRQ